MCLVCYLGARVVCGGMCLGEGVAHEFARRQQIQERFV